jgi:gamma-glutamyltranspeptidase/glutathione hydrolase
MPLLRETWTVTKPALRGRAGLVASQHYAASEAGARMLEQGGNAVDAAIAASLVIGTVEPWMSGLGGGAFMLVREAGSGRVSAVDAGMRASRHLDPADYPLIGGVDDDLFGWPGVHEQRNVNGPLSIAVPGYLAGIGLAAERFASRPLAELVAPAIDSARAGMDVDWFATLKIAAAAPVLSRYEHSARTYLPAGFAPCGEWGGPVPRVHLEGLQDSLEQIASAGWRDFYVGELASRIAADLRDVGARVDAADLAAYQARILDADELDYRGTRVFTAPGLNAGPTLRDVLTRLARVELAKAPDAVSYQAYADAMLQAYEVRLATLGDADEQRAPSCTTHLSVVDGEGNMVALTQTLLSVFGSKVVLPRSGVLANNGVMWFDPRPGRPNSMAPGKRPLSNMCPVIARRDDGVCLAAGASGGRRIMSAVLQLLSFVCDFHMDIDAAVHQPRIDVSGSPVVTVFENMPRAVVDALAQGREVRREPNAVYPALYACPNLVSRDPASGECSGGAFIMSPWSAVAGPGATAS